MDKQDQEYQSVMKENIEKISEHAQEKAKKEAFKKIITILGVKGVIILLLVVLFSSIFAVIFLAGALYINDFDTWEKASEAKENAIGQQALGKVLQLEGNKYKITYDGKEGKEALDALLKEHNMNYEDFTDEEIEVLYKCLRAEWATTYPNLGEAVDKDNEDYIQGVITITRKSINDTERELKYKPYEEFETINNEDALNYFSMKDGNIIVANWSTREVTYEITGNMPESMKSSYQNTGTQYTINKTAINYRNILGIHTLPFEFTLALLVNTQNKDFVNELADLAFNSKMVITVYDNTTETIDVENYHFNETTKYNKKEITYHTQSITTAEGSHTPVSITKGETKTGNVNIDEKDIIDYYVKTTRNTKDNSYIVGLTDVESWFSNVKNVYQYIEEPGEEKELDLGETIKDSESLSEDLSASDSDVQAFLSGKAKTKTKTDEEGKVQTTKTTGVFEEGKKIGTKTKEEGLTENTTKQNIYRYEKNPNSKNEEIGKKFKEIYDKYPGVEGVFKTADSWLFELLENSEDTIDYVTVLKYLLQICTGEYYGISEEDLQGILDIFEEAQTYYLNGNTSGTETGWWWPVGPDASGKTPVSTNISSRFNSYRSYKSAGHGAIDISVAKGAPIIASRGGTVIAVKDGFGDGKYDLSYRDKANWIKIEHPDGTQAWYWHLSQGLLVKAGDTVVQGQEIAKSGNSGFTSGPHLHFEVHDKNGNKVDPETFVSPSKPYPEPINTNIYGGSLQEKVWFALKDLNYSDIAVAGAMGNIDYESAGFKATAVESTGEGIGLIQWSHGRKEQLLAYAESKGISWQDENTQIEFLVTEISGQGKAVGYATKRTSGYIREEGPGAKGTHDQWKNATTIEDATLYFMRFFESPRSKKSLSERQSRANKYYEQFKDSKKSGEDN